MWYWTSGSPLPRWIGIEKEAEYVAIAEARLNGVQKGLGLSA